MEVPHGRNLRKGRFSERNRIYLVTTVTYRRVPIFSDVAMGRLLVRTLMSEAPRAKTIAYVVMPHHLHWLMELHCEDGLAVLMHAVKSVSAHRINLHRKCRERVWQSGYHDHAIRREEDIKELARYVVGNPLRAGLVERIGDYPLWDAVWI